ncbi:MAG TPA: MFS transporter [Rhizomicrobium sp.]|jgi:predicted MFS family arabinose efflux permease
MSISSARVFNKRTGLAFVVAFGIVSFFADMAYEGMRGIAGPFLAALGASGAAVGIIAGGGEMAGYLLRLVSGRAADRTRLYWPMTLSGYVIQMTAVPLLALAGSWWLAAVLIVIERAGKAVRNPPRDMMLSRAGEEIGQGWAFGLHEALDQTGALIGPLVAALVLWLHHDYRAAFAWLAVPSALTLVLVFGVCWRTPQAGQIAAPEHHDGGRVALPRAYWFYAASAALVAFGFADFTLISFHFGKVHIVAETWIPIFYALAMGAAGAGSLVFGRWFDARGLAVLIPGTLIGAVVAPLAFLGGVIPALIGTVLWGIALGIHEAIMSAAVASMVPVHARARAIGLFTAIFGVAWFLGSAALGALYDVSRLWVVVVSVLPQLLALAPLALALRSLSQGRAKD